MREEKKNEKDCLEDLTMKTKFIVHLMCGLYFGEEKKLHQNYIWENTLGLNPKPRTKNEIYENI